MPFIWVQGTTTPTQPSPLSYGPNTVSTQVGLVANSVNVQPPPICTVLYNTPNIGYDIICMYQSLNAAKLTARTLIAENAKAEHTVAENANIGHATINTAFIANANISYLFMNTDPTINSHMATKGYVDALVANSVPLGGNLQLLIQAAGDLLVGVADNVAERQPVGSNKRILASTNTGNTKVAWRSAGSNGDILSSFNRLFMQTHRTYPTGNNIIELLSAGEMIMEDGTRTTNWPHLTVSSQGNGAPGFLDTGTVRSNTWYEIYAIRNPTTQDRGLILHMSADKRTVANSSNIRGSAGFNIGTFVDLKNTSPTAYTTLAQQFTPIAGGRLASVETAFSSPIAVPVGNCWMTIEHQDLTGNADGTPLITSRYKYIGDMGYGTTSIQRFLFDEPFDIVANTPYSLVVNTEYPFANLTTNQYIRWWGYGIDDYPSGNARGFIGNTGSWSTTGGVSDYHFKVIVNANATSVVLPTGYTQKCLIGYTRTDKNGAFKPFTQRNRKVTTSPYHHPWLFMHNAGESGIQSLAFTTMEVATLEQVVPPVRCIAHVGPYPGGTTGVYSIGSLYSRFLTPATVSTPPSPRILESNGWITGNTASSQSIEDWGPILVEEQAYNVATISFGMPVHLNSFEF